ncbi:mimitin, mitochondrial-like isoform X2 [Limulus polyphemus]|uniref:Mimitin, mitochondrial-like isoform X2 n=1 Tax=Limulus polyphemus TaxID=6850 RepID=A0ABM1BAT6_LIMPO|nr:mimitin, mitochondrial-like isoform X2 [Limulus polyphemus]
MASSSGSRSILRMIIKNFIESVTPRKRRGDFVGRDNFGNKYYEIPPDPSRGKRYPVRWYETKVSDDWEQEIPTEWEAWLRGRRTSAPGIEEIEINARIMEMKKQKGAEVEDQARKERELKTQSKENSETRELQKKSFPVYEDYEKNPGDSFEKISRDKR